MSIFIFVSPVVSSSDNGNECFSGLLHSANESSPPYSLTNSLIIKLLPEEQVKVLQLRLLLMNKEQQQLYRLGFDAEMGVHWGDVSVTMRDEKSMSNILKISWPPVLLPQVWTTLHIRLSNLHLLHFSAFPVKQNLLPRLSRSHSVTLTPLAVSTRLVRSGVSLLRLELLTDTSVKYNVNCGKEYLATSFAAEFGIASSVPYWRAWTWILLGIVILLIIINAIFFIKLLFKNKEWLSSFFVTTKTSTSSYASFKKSGEDKSLPQTMDKLQSPSISTGVVSSRAPSPGQYVDENTFDYVNQAFTSD
ncbi:hypothetical protein SK128_020232 [Halocaridina rubra]|uniref:Uncharacterized protein n=1 Tax=Halocaridina rubra TaxID=373956 RepID=A0AAN8WP37_HALRR